MPRMRAAPRQRRRCHVSMLLTDVDAFAILRRLIPYLPPRWRCHDAARCHAALMARQMLPPPRYYAACRCVRSAATFALAPEADAARPAMPRTRFRAAPRWRCLMRRAIFTRC